MAVAVIAAGFVFIAVAALVLALTSANSGSVVEKRLARLDQTKAASEPTSVLRTDTGTFPLLRRLATGNAWSEGTATLLAQAGWNLKVSEYLLMRISLAVFAGAAIGLLTSASGLGLLFAIAAAAIGFMLPSLVLHYFRARRQQAIASQLVEMLGLISNSLRSGFAFTQAVELAAKQLEPPISEELERLIHDISLGASTDTALQQMAERTGSYDLDMMVATIVIQRTTGGNLSEILDNVAETVRERDRLQGEIRALTASQRFTGLVLSFYPVILGLAFFAIAPDTWKVLVTEETGRLLLAIAVVLQVFGAISIRRILRLEV